MNPTVITVSPFAVQAIIMTVVASGVVAVISLLVAVAFFAFSVDLLIYGTERLLKLLKVYVEFCKWLQHRKEFSAWLIRKNSIQSATDKLDLL